MKSLSNISSQPLSVPLVADEITELHAARMLLLLLKCGTGNRIKGLTKLAKLDFLVRYPAFFTRLAAHLGEQISAVTETVESAMTRHHYGPWDKRYYKVLPFLESRNLITVSKQGTAYVFELSAEGKKLASTIAKQPEFAEQVEQMKRVKALVGKKSGSTLKNLIYSVFDAEVVKKPLGDIIR